MPYLVSNVMNNNPEYAKILIKVQNLNLMKGKNNRLSYDKNRNKIGQY